MKKLVLLGVVLVWMAGLHAVDLTWNYAVQITVAAQASPPQLTLNWLQDSSGTPAAYTVYRKAPAATSWGSPLATLPGTTLNYTDTNVAAGTVYEYQIVKDFTAAQGYNGYGYVQSGILVPLADHRGTVILIVDNSFSSALAAELAQLQQDLIGDGWSVIRHDVGRGDSVPSVKHLIVADYQANPSDVNAVFLFGHVPVPYSGLLNPDGHPDHLGAWPADPYYGDMTGVYTDSSVNYVQNQNSDPVDAARLTNVPGDGKFDQSTIPGTVALEVGRVDLANMPGDLQFNADPSFPSEQELLRQYLHKDHAFRTAAWALPRRALIGDYIGFKEGIAPAASAFRSFAPMFGDDPSEIVSLNVADNDQQGLWLPELQKNAYLWTCAFGAGSYQTISGVGTEAPYFTASTTDLVSADPKAAFYMMLGSWCGDWDHPDVILKAPLAAPTYGLAAVFQGVPHWFFHPMALGETLGYCTRLTQNNTNPGLYMHQVNQDANEVHIALMGDPTLRLDPVAPPSGLTVSGSGPVTLSWSASPDSGVSGYAVYRGASATGPFVRLNAGLVGGTTYSDASPVAGSTYLVRAVKLMTVASGSYYNGSEGIFVNGGNSGTTASPSRLINLSVRSNSGAGGAALAAGFSIGGSGSLPVLVRATGPALQAFGVTGVLADPVLTVYQGGSQVAFDDNWGANASQITAADSAVGAFPLTDAKSGDAALATAFASGGYSAVVGGANGGTGVALVEVYDASASGTVSPTGPRLTNLSAKTAVGTGSDILTVGFVIAGSSTEQVVIRGIGPGLTGFGVAGVLTNPELTLRDSQGNVIATNAGWGGNAALAAAFAKVNAFALDPNSPDAALLATLQPGAYTAQVSGANGGTGVALAEVYEVSE